MGPFIAFGWGHPSFLDPFNASVLDPFVSYLGLISPSFIIERLDPYHPCPYHPLEAVQQVFLIILVELILARLVVIDQELVLKLVVLHQQVVIDHSYLF